MRQLDIDRVAMANNVRREGRNRAGTGMLGLRPTPPKALTPVAPPFGGYDSPQQAGFMDISG